MLLKATLIAGAFAALASAQSSSSNNTIPAKTDARTLALVDVEYANSGLDDSGCVAGRPQGWATRRKDASAHALFASTETLASACA